MISTISTLPSMKALYICMLLFYITVCSSLSDNYTEELVISRLPSGNILSQFRFVVFSGDLQLGPEYSLFPRIVSELISSHSVGELSLSLGQGRWWADQWGLPPQPSAPTGAHVHAVINGDHDKVDDKWKALINSLNGVFCTSLTSVVPTLTTSPTLSFTPRSSLSKGHVRYAALSKESLCTENLTPWKKLLPCKQNGLSTLLNPVKLYSSLYHSMGLTLFPVCEDNNCSWRLELNLNMVSDVDLKTRKLDWDIESLFGKKVSGICHAATSTSILVRLDQEGMILDPLPSTVIGGYGIYNLSKDNAIPSFFFSADYSSGSVTQQIDRNNIIRMTSVTGGCNQHSGTLVTSIENSGMKRHAVFTHLLPWFVQIQYHTLRISCSDKLTQSLKLVKTHSRKFVPAISRQRSALIEWDFELPNDSLCEISFAFDKAFLRLREYPPDANHGLYVPAAALTILDTAGLMNGIIGSVYSTGLQSVNSSVRTGTDEVVVHSNVLLIALPTPDFSMPFNVICFVLSAISICFGPIHSFSTKMLIPINSSFPMAPKFKKILRGLLILLLIGACYAQYNEIGMNEMRRAIGKAFDAVKESFEKMNSM